MLMKGSDPWNWNYPSLDQARLPPGSQALNDPLRVHGPETKPLWNF